jgi:RimJ/RimL family protein N-acetyltransferase
MDIEKVDIRYSKLEDEKDLIHWLQDPENNKWFPFSEEKEIKESVKNWIGYSKYKASLTATINDKPIAVGTLFLMPYRKVSHLCMFYLIVDKDFRRKKIGTSMLKNLLNLAKSYFYLESVYIEIFEGCDMLYLLKKFDFKEIAYQRYYVKNNDKFSARILLEHRF